MNFLLTEMTFLKYFIPLTIEGNSRDIKSKYFVGQNQKYNNPGLFTELLEKLADRFNFELYKINNIKEHNGLTFMIEGCGADYLNTKHKKVVLTYMSDYRLSYGKYLDKVDHIIFPSKKFAEHYNTISKKNLYLGSPKYDIDINEKEVIKKYNLPNNKKALIIYPKLRDIKTLNLESVFNAIKNRGYEVLFKVRAKDQIQKKYKSGRYFSDESWYPHTTMELITVSDLTITFGSTTFKESIMLNTPVINFNIKPHKHLSFFYKNPFFKNFDNMFDEKKFNSYIDDIQNNKYEEEFEKYKKDFLFELGSSKRILNYFNEEV